MRRLPRQVQPRLIEVEYAKALVRLTERAWAALEPLRDAAPGVRMDSSAGRRTRRLAAKARTQLEKDVSPATIERLARKFAERTSTHQRIQMGRQVRAVLGSNVLASDKGAAAAVEAFVDENVALIRTIPTAMADRLEQAITRAVASGTRHEVLAKEIEQIWFVGERRARIIARDQVGKLYGQLNAVRHQAIGVRRFIWRTVGDQRVRPAHQALNGREFSYPDGAPGEGLPGQPILCRCFPDPVLDDLLAELDRL